MTEREPAALKHRGRATVMHRIEQQLRFLAVCTDLIALAQCHTFGT